MPTKKRATGKTKLPAEQQSADSQSVKPVATGSSGKALSVFAILFSLLAMGAAAYTWYESQVRQVQSNANVAVGVTEIGGKISRLADNMQRIEKTQQELNEEVQPLASRQQELMASVDKINKSLQKGVNQYLIDQVQQLMIIANNHLLLSKDVTMAASALQQADVLLDSLSNPQYTPVRQLLSQEMVALKQVEMPDTLSLTAQLLSMSKLVPSLPLQNEPSVTPFTDIEEQAPEPENYTWKTEVRQLFKDILGAVQIQRVEQAPKPLLMPEQRYYLNRNIQLELSSAEFAVLKSEQAIFVSNLETARGWLNEYFDLGNDRVKKMISDLQALEQTQLNPVLPDISGSYNALNEIKGN